MPESGTIKKPPTTKAFCIEKAAGDFTKRIVADGFMNR